VIAALSLLAGLAKGPQPASVPEAMPSIRVETFAMLDRLRDEKRRQLGEYLARLKARADQAGRDEVLLRSFALLRRHDELSRQEGGTPQGRRARRQLEANVARHVLERYADFADLLMVAPDGSVFYALRRGELKRMNLLRGPGHAESLAGRLGHRERESFVDFHRCRLCDEPSAFFVEPLGEADGGWIVLRTSIRRLNRLFRDGGRIGRTCETFLVNEHCQMLTDSRFRRDSSILTQHLSDENIRGKFAQGRGHKVVTDYRGFRALSSFDVCRMMGARWLLVAKIDRAEVVTQRYRRRREQLAPALGEALASSTCPSSPAGPTADANATVVHMDEFRRGRPSQRLRTWGIRTCTGLVIHRTGSFAYLGHASTRDALYGGKSLDLLGHMLRRVTTYEICPYELRTVKALVVAPHTDSATGAIDRLVDAGLFLSQIRFVQGPAGSSARLVHDVSSGETVVEWTSPDLAAPLVHRAADAPTVADLFRPLLDY
jgi:hypothetical protein